MMFRKLRFVIAAIGATGVVLAMSMLHHRATLAMVRNDEPGGTENAAELARAHPDEYAWQLFFYINRQASNESAGVPDPHEATFLDDQSGKAVVWEGWALASGDAESEVFNGCQPKLWKGLTNRQQIPGDPLSPNLTESVDNTLPPAGGATLPKAENRNTADNARVQMLQPIPPRGLELQVEIRYNQELYEEILKDELWNREAINKKVLAAKTAHKGAFITFPPGAKAIKAAWVELCNGEASCADQNRYHWRQVTNITGTHVYGLAALHIMTKEKNMPNWFWADFIHVDCLHGQGDCPYPTPKPFVGTASSDGVRSETSNSSWQNYRLMGTQTAFTTASGNSQLSDPRIESLEKNPSSCITCHDYASTYPIPTSEVPGRLLPTLNSEILNVPGPPNKCILNEDAVGNSCGHDASRKYIQSDFIWSIEKLAQTRQNCPTK